MREEQSEEDIHDAAVEDARDEMIGRYNEIEDILCSLGNEFVIYREICVKDHEEFLSELGECSEVGVFWAKDEEHAISYWGHDDEGIVLVARARLSDIDTYHTVLSFIKNRNEYEIRLKEGSRIFIVEAIIRQGCGDRYEKKTVGRVDVGKPVLA